ncbi:hypothetical protein ACK1KB_00885 [Chryseobacterium sp. TY3]|uniref:Uncharacterized protein n=1 Tax=Soonwooa buanensis TaxID=619805 RepID=A0A1T5EWC3_9FLAO|nr:hypothetical protein [Soonwooa buanensis]SKB88010.1 hypothetical protein SAMN05660477_01629 [Soonwooa buanensis]
MKKILNPKYLLIAVAVFVVLFLMNYIGNDNPDKVERAVLTGLGGVAGLTIWMLFFNKDNDPPQNFD